MVGDVYDGYWLFRLRLPKRPPASPTTLPADKRAGSQGMGVTAFWGSPRTVPWDI